MLGEGETGTCKSDNNFFSQISSAAALAMALYPASVEHLETDFCLDDLQEMALEPKYTTYTVVERLMSFSPP